MHARLLAAEAAAAGSEVVFACGGDGTVNEVVNGLVGTPASLAVLRGGTGNVFAKEVHVPRSPANALGVLTRGEEYEFDLGIAGGRHFLLMAGTGFDGSVVRRVPSVPKRLLGTTSYILWGAAEALRFKGRPVELSIDGELAQVELYWLLLANTRSYGGVVDVAARAKADDGLLDTYVFTGSGLPWMLGMGGRIVLQRHHDAPGVHFQRSANLEIRTPGLHVQADGEYFGETPMSFLVVPRSLRVLVPPGGAAKLVSAPPQAHVMLPDSTR